ncbi:fatty acid desaturase-domain-containing protein [Limtongia smithiae]|uniref:fatty acid desaturase-domain-containing protein n=1 Tax=Limtongia smithiae TaxID=1125753 RepID=UPI0034CD9A38
MRSASLTSMKLSDQILSRRTVEAMIADGKSIIIYENRVLRVDSWLPKHPGGEKVVFHMVGRDATDEINAYHCEETKAQVRKYQIGRVLGPWVNFVPPIQGGKFRSIGTETPVDDEAISVGSYSSSLASSEASIASSSDEEAAGFTTSAEQAKMATARRIAAPCNEYNAAKMTATKKTKKPLEKVVVAPQRRELPEAAELLAEYEQKAYEMDVARYPTVDHETQAYITQKYRELEARLQEGGYFQCTYWGYGRECVRYFLFGLLAYMFLRIKWYCTSAFFLGVLWHQLTFTVHDSAHYAITHNFLIDNLIGGFIADYVGGLSVGWWKRNHNVHHVVTNDPIHDPDIQHLPFFAVSTKLFGNVFSTYYERVLQYDAFAHMLIPIQNYMYYPILCFGRFNLYRLSWEYLIRGLGPRHGKAAWFRYYEILGMIVFWYWFGYKLVYQTLPSNRVRFVYIMISHIVTMPLHVQITLSHFAMSTADLGAGESFAQKMLRTTMDVDCPTWLDFFHGGLQFQAVHHLFPRLPRHNLRDAQAHVIEFCKEVDVQYCIYGFVDGNKEVISRLADIGKQASIMADCSSHIAQEVAVSGRVEM